jgi:hypothetical protein
MNPQYAIAYNNRGVAYEFKGSTILHWQTIINVLNLTIVKRQHIGLISIVDVYQWKLKKECSGTVIVTQNRADLQGRGTVVKIPAAFNVLAKNAFVGRGTSLRVLFLYKMR